MPWSLKKNHVLVPYDFSSQSREALRVARTFVDEPSSLTLMNVVQEVIVPPYAMELANMLDMGTVKERSREALEKVLEEEGMTGAKVVVESDRPALAILAFAEDNGAELIVMPTHGRTGLPRFAIGSVTERVVRRAHCPVLVLRNEPE